MVGIGFGISVIGCEFDEDVSNVSLVCQRKEGSFRLCLICFIEMEQG